MRESQFAEYVEGSISQGVASKGRNGEDFVGWKAIEARIGVGPEMKGEVIGHEIGTDLSPSWF